MRYATYVRKYEESLVKGLPSRERQRLKRGLQAEVRKAANAWLLKEGLLGDFPTVQDYLAGWHQIRYEFSLGVSSSVTVILLGVDQTFSAGYSEKEIARHRVSKRVLFT